MKKGKRAWLITWQWYMPRDKREPRVVCILDSRYKEDRICSISQALFIQGEPLTLGEMIYHGQPYRKLTGCWRTTPEGICFGYKPYLYARIVDNLRVESDQNGKDILKWTEPEKGRIDDKGQWITTTPASEDSWIYRPKQTGPAIHKRKK